MSVSITVLDEVGSFQISGVTSPVALGATARYSLSVFSPEPNRHPLPEGTYRATWSLRLGTEEVVSVEGEEFSYRLVSEGLYYIDVSCHVSCVWVGVMCRT